MYDITRIGRSRGGAEKKNDDGKGKKNVYGHNIQQHKKHIEFK